jgi:chemotaxis protein MotB
VTTKAKKGSNLPPPIIVKKIIVAGGGGHHGGAWKVAYADFVTAMMAFFLLLWLLGATNENQRKGIADYFSPTLVKMREQSAGSNGMFGGDSITSADNYPHRASQTGTRSITIPRDTTGGPREGATEDRKIAQGPTPEQKALKLNELRQRVTQRVETQEKLKRLASQIRFVQTREGIRIDLVDDADFSMFQLGTTVLVPEAVELLRIIGDAVKDESGALTIRGHTDSLPWRRGQVASNWSLSSGRAEATRQTLMRFGVLEPRFRRIEGVADREPLIVKTPTDPRNRRISITIAD